MWKNSINNTIGSTARLMIVLAVLLMLSLTLSLTQRIARSYAAFGCASGPCTNLPNDIQQAAELYDSTANNPNQYLIDDWTSQYGQPTNDTGLSYVIAYGTKNVALQVNSIDYVYHALLVGTPLWPSDGTPNGAAISDALQTRTYLASITPTVNGALSGCVSFSNGSNGQNPCSASNGAGYPGGVTQTIGFTSGTRFWQSGTNAPVGFYYVPAGGSFTKTETVLFTLDYTQINEFKNNGQGYCVAGGSAANSIKPPANCGGAKRTDSITFAVGAKPPTDTHAPTITAAPSCSAVDVTGKVSDADDPGASLTVNYAVDGGATQSLTSTGSYSVDMSSYDQLTAHSVKLWVNDINSAGAAGSLPATYAPTVTYGPCFVPACGSITVTPSAVEVTTPFTMTAYITFAPAGPAPNNGPASGPATIHGTLTETIDGQSASDTNASLVSGSFTIGSPGSYPTSFHFTDGSVTTSPSPCPGTTVIAGYTPYVSVIGGDVEAGSGGFGSSCSPTSAAAQDAGILAFNNGLTGSANAGAGTDLASYAPNIINGFASADGQSVPGFSSFINSAPNGLSFANAYPHPPIPDPQDPTFGGGFGPLGAAGCAPDYYGQARTAVPNGPQPQSSVQLSDLSGVNGCLTDTNLSSGVASTNCWFTASPGGDVTIAGAGNLTGLTTIYVNGDVLIDGNISLDPGPWAGIDQIPSLTIVSDANIYIDSSVTAIAGIFVAQPPTPNPDNVGDIFTCTNGHSMFSAAALFHSCGDYTGPGLTVQGALVANQVRLERTSGSVHGADNQPAETVDYGPTDWLSQASSNYSNLPTNPVYDSITALAPVL